MNKQLLIQNIKERSLHVACYSTVRNEHGQIRTMCFYGTSVGFTIIVDRVGLNGWLGLENVKQDLNVAQAIKFVNSLSASIWSCYDFQGKDFQLETLQA